MTVTIVSRAEWGARTPTRITPFSQLPRRVIIHHGASTSGHSGADERALIRGYQNIHMDSRGWTDIAYNLLVGQSGTIYEGRGVDRVGGATGSPWDTESISICLVGNFQHDEPTPELVDALVGVIADLIEQGDVVPDPEISGHLDHSSTACPGSNVVALLPELRRRVAASTTDQGDVMKYEDIAEGWRRFNSGDADAVTFVQTALRTAAMYGGRIDGKPGDKTAASLGRFKAQYVGGGDEPLTTILPPLWRALIGVAVGAVPDDLEAKAYAQAKGDLAIAEAKIAAARAALA